MSEPHFVTCPDCGNRYDEQVCTALCPHHSLDTADPRIQYRHRADQSQPNRSRAMPSPDPSAPVEPKLKGESSE
jgi:hypothetical protein